MKFRGLKTQSVARNVILKALYTKLDPKNPDYDSHHRNQLTKAKVTVQLEGYYLKI